VADVARSLDGLGAAEPAVLAAALARGLAERPDRRRVLLLDVIVAARRDPQVAEVLRGGLEAYVRATAGALDSAASLARVLAVLNLGMVVFAALEARTPAPPEFAHLVEALLPAAGDADADASDLDRVRRLAIAADEADAALRAAIAAAVEDGFSLRQVGAAANRSHEAVRKIAR
jgi:hypothetical protein